MASQDWKNELMSQSEAMRMFVISYEAMEEKVNSYEQRIENEKKSSYTCGIDHQHCWNFCVMSLSGIVTVLTQYGLPPRNP